MSMRILYSIVAAFTDVPNFELVLYLYTVIREE